MSNPFDADASSTSVMEPKVIPDEVYECDAKPDTASVGTAEATITRSAGANGITPEDVAANVAPPAVSSAVDSASWSVSPVAERRLAACTRTGVAVPADGFSEQDTLEHEDVHWAGVVGDCSGGRHR